MKHYIDKNNELFAYEDDGSQDHLIGDKKPVTQEKAKAHVDKKSEEFFNSVDYSVKRMREYPSISEFIEIWARNDEVEIKTLKAKVLKVMEKYPRVD